MRLRHAAEYYSLNEAKAAKLIRGARLGATPRSLRRYFSAEIDDPTLYNVDLDTGPIRL